MPGSKFTIENYRVCHPERSEGSRQSGMDVRDTGDLAARAKNPLR